MFDKVEARYALRCVLTGVFTAVSAMIASIYGEGLGWNEVLLAVLLGVSGALVRAGVGYASPQVEPNIGNKA